MNKNKFVAFRITGHDFEPFIKAAQKRGLSISEGIRLAIKTLRQQWELQNSKKKI